MLTICVREERDTALLAGAVEKSIQGGVSVGLSGALGAGKTTFVRYLVGAMGGVMSDVTSPSYTLSYEYPVKNGLTLEHWDLYRLTSAPEELFERPGERVVRLIEWPERGAQLNELELHLTFSVLEDGARILTAAGNLAAKLAHHALQLEIVST